MRKLSVSVLSVTLCLLLLVSGACASMDAEPVEFNADVQAPPFSMTAAGGQVLTSENFGAGRNLLLVYGRITCGNTQAFLRAIKNEVGLLAENGVTVLVGLHNDPPDEDINGFSEVYGGVLCAKVSDEDSGMWTGLDAVGAGAGMVIFPVIFLRSADGRLRYYSTGYVEEPLSVVAAAIEMSSEPILQNAEIVLPDDLKRIEAEAFRKGTFASVYCGKNLSSIGAYAFAENTALKWIYIPSSVRAIDSTAFKDCADTLIIYGKEGSYAQTFAGNNGITFKKR